MERISRKLIWLFFVSFFMVSFLGRALADSPQIMIILDASGSMYGQINGKAKIDIAKEVIHKIVPAISKEVKVGLSAYGHHRKGDCSDIEILIKPGASSRDELLSRMDNITPKGMTPIAQSIKKVTDVIKENEAETTIILVSDGKETCVPDPCGTVKSLKNSGVKFVLDVIGFDVSPEEKKQLMCIAKAGGGKYYSASDADSLLSALNSVKKEVEQKIKPAQSTKKTISIGLGKLDIEFDKNVGGSIFMLKVINKKTGKLTASKEFHNSYVPSIKFPLLSGDYEIRSYCCGIYREGVGEFIVGNVHIDKGKTTVYKPGVILLNFSKEMKYPLITAVTYEKTDEPKTTMTQKLTGGYPYCVQAPKAIMPGVYNVTVTQDRTSITVAKAIKVTEGKVVAIDIDTGFRIKKSSNNVFGYKLVKAGEKKPAIEAYKDHFRNIQFEGKYIVKPGTYDLYLFVEGVQDPLPAATGLEIKKGEVLEFDATI